MSEASKLIDSIKKDLRAILQSLPGGLPLKGLLLDYKKFLGYELPYRKLGYSTADELLRDLPDAVTCHFVAGEKIYRAVATEETKHIEKLVSKQKVSTSGYPRGLTRVPNKPVPNKLRGLSAPQQLPSDAKVRASSLGRTSTIDIPAMHRLSGLIALKPTRPTSNSHASPVALPEYVKRDIRDFLHSYPSGLLCKQLNGAFQKSFAYSIDFHKYGYPNIEAMLTSSAMIDFVSIRNTGKELKVLAKQQPQSEKSASSKQNIVSWLHNVTVQPPCPNSQPAFNNGTSQEFFQDAQHEYPPLQSSEVTLFNNRHSPEHHESITYQSLDSDPHALIPRPNPTIPPFPTRHETKWNVPPLLSVDTVASHIRSASSPPFVRNPPPHVLLNCHQTYEVQDEDEEEKFTTGVQVGDRMKANIRKILEKHPQGVNYLAFPAKYKEETGHEFIFQDLGVYNIMDVMTSIPDIVTYYRPNVHSSYTLYDARLRPDVDATKKSNYEDEEEPKVRPLPEEFKRKLVKLLEQFHPDGLSMISIPRHYRTMYNEEMVFDQYGYSSLEFLLLSLVDDVVIMQYEEEGVQVHLAHDAPCKYMEAIPKDISQNAAPSSQAAAPSSQPSAPSSQPSAPSKQSSARTVCTSARLQPLPYFTQSAAPLTKPAAPACFSMPSVPSKASDPTFKTKTTVADARYISSSESKMAQPTPLLQPYRNSVHDEVLRNYEVCPPGFINSNAGIPSDACLPGRTINLQEIPNNWIVKQKDKAAYENYHLVIASHVESPDLFWMQLKGENSSERLKTVMNDLETAYCMDSDQMEQYTIRQRHLQIGMLCVAKYENDWHRAQMVAIPNQENVTVSYIDYGTVTDVSRTGVKYLKERFAAFPAQALQAKLANVVPPNNEKQWSTEARKIFFESSTKAGENLLALLLAKIIHPDTKKQVLSVCLTDMSNPADEVHINDFLAEEGLAEFRDMMENRPEEADVPSPPASVHLPSVTPLAASLKSPVVSQPSTQGQYEAFINAYMSAYMSAYVMPGAAGIYPPLLQQTPAATNLYKPMGSLPNYQSMVPPQGLMSNNWPYGTVPMWHTAMVPTSSQYPIPPVNLPAAAPAMKIVNTPTNMYMPSTTHPPPVQVSGPNNMSNPLYVRTASASHEGLKATKSQQNVYSVPSATVVTSDGKPANVPPALPYFSSQTAESAAQNTMTHTIVSSLAHNHCDEVKASFGEPDSNDIGKPIINQAALASGDAPSNINGFPTISKQSSLTPDYDSVADDMNIYADDDAYIEQLCRELDSIPLVKKRNIKLVELTPEHKVHLVFYDKELHMVGFEVSAFFWKMDVLRNILRIQKLKVNSHIITEESDPELFADLLQYNLRNSEASTATLYPLSSVLILVDKFKPSAEALRRAIVHEQEYFNPHDSYWGSVNLSMADAPTPRITMGEFNDFTLGVLRNRRQEIVMQLQEEQSNSALLEELNLLDSKIEMLEQESEGR